MHPFAFNLENIHLTDFFSLTDIVRGIRIKYEVWVVSGMGDEGDDDDGDNAAAALV